MVSFSNFRWIMNALGLIFGLAACSGSSTEPLTTSAIQPVEVSVPAPTTSAPAATTIPVTTEPATTVAPTATAPTTTAPYGGRFTDRQVAAIEGYLDASEAFRRSMGSPDAPDIEALTRTHDDESLADNLGFLQNASDRGAHTNYRGGTRPSVEIYEIIERADTDLEIVLCLIDDVDVYDGETLTEAMTWALAWQVRMTERDGTWILRAARPGESREDVACPEP
jgi:hypothetical protein